MLRTLKSKTVLRSFIKCMPNVLWIHGFKDSFFIDKIFDYKMMTYWEIGLTIYSGCTTLTLLIGSIYVICKACKTRAQRNICPKCSKKLLSSPDDKEQHLVDYDSGSNMHPTYSLPSLSIRQNQNDVQFVYDPIICTSVAIKTATATKTTETSQFGSTEVLLSDDYHHYETIIDSVVNTLSDLHKHPKEKTAAQVYNIFLNQLIEKMRSKNPELYQNLHHQSRYSTMSKNHYEQISEQQTTPTDDDEDDETYVRYVGGNKRQRTLSAPAYRRENISKRTRDGKDQDHRSKNINEMNRLIMDLTTLKPNVPFGSSIRQDRKPSMESSEPTNNPPPR